MDGIKLVGLWMQFPEPEPLCDGGFDECGRRVGVVFEKFWRRDAIVAKSNRP